MAALSPGEEQRWFRNAYLFMQASHVQIATLHGMREISFWLNIITRRLLSTSLLLLSISVREREIKLCTDTNRIASEQAFGPALGLEVINTRKRCRRRSVPIPRCNQLVLALRIGDGRATRRAVRRVLPLLRPFPGRRASNSARHCRDQCAGPRRLN